MLEKPLLRDETIAACLRQGYAVTVARITFLPLGQDKHAWVYRVDAADGAAYFLKVRRPPVDELNLALPRYLRDNGFACVAPLPAGSGALWNPAGDFILLLYPFIEGRTGMDGGMTPRQWELFGATLQRLHATTLPPALARAVPRERFIPAPQLSDIVRALLDGRHEAHLTSELARELAAFLREKRDDVQRILVRIAELGRLLQGRRSAYVLCHADIHINNVLLDTQGQLWFVDWDQPLCAPRERDLMCVLGPAMQGVMPNSPEEAAFWRGYGAHEVDPTLLTYYRYERALQDIGEYAELIYWMPDRSDDARRDAVRRLRGMFGPGKHVAEAFRSDEQLSARS